jgi:tRNA nucleotidyltransferase (CCA-adding enzyme)
LISSLKHRTGRLPPFLSELIGALAGIGRPLLVGGCVRDWLMGREPKDYDVEVYGASQASVDRALARFGSVDPVGRSFGIIKFRRDGIDFDISLPRRERKVAQGHRGFEVGTDPTMSPADALARRDFTINAMAFDTATGNLLDPLGGTSDLEQRILRHPSEAFVEDPLRVLRAFQFAGRFDFRVNHETAALCASIAGSFGELPVERIWGEWAKWAGESIRPSAGLRALEQTGWLMHFPEIANLRGLEQEPEWHPEGDVFEHTCHCVDVLASLPEWKSMEADERRVLMLAVLSHDFGKAGTTAREERHGMLRWTSPGHETASGPLAENLLARIGAPLDFAPRIRRLVENHHSHHHGPVPPSAAAVRRLARRLTPATLAQWLLVLRADHLGRPPLVSDETRQRIDAWAAAAQELALRDSAPKPILLGRHLISAGLKPGPAFKAVLDEAFEAQLEGGFSDESGAREWLDQRLAQGGDPVP